MNNEQNYFDYMIVELTDINGNIIDKKFSVCSDYVTLSYKKNGIYFIKTTIFNKYITVKKCVKINLCCYEYNVIFMLKQDCKCIPTGKIIINLSDENYSELKLEKGEYSLWLGLK